MRRDAVKGAELESEVRFLLKTHYSFHRTNINSRSNRKDENSYSHQEKKLPEAFSFDGFENQLSYLPFLIIHFVTEQ